MQRQSGPLLPELNPSPTLMRNAGPVSLHRRVSDRSNALPQGDHGTGAAQHLLERRTVLDAALQPDETQVAGLMGRTPPVPIALLMIDAPRSRERLTKLLHGAKVEIEEARDAEKALGCLAQRTHALMFTDNLQLIQRARHLATGAATHIIYLNASGDAGYREGLRAGASDCMPSDARGEQFWAQMTTVRRIIDLAASLQLAVTDNRILATIDELTRCGSRRFFESQFPREVERAARLAVPLALMFCDIDHFKAINDRYGHPTGDGVLREFADRLTHGLRASDWVARTGGEEFAVVLPDTAGRESRAIAERLRAKINSVPFPGAAEPLVVTASFGFSALDQVPREYDGIAQRLIDAADEALYRSKDTGRNCVTESSADPM